MADQKPLLSTHTHEVDPETGRVVMRSTFQMGDGITAERLGDWYALLSDAAWLELARTNQRTWVANEVRRFEQQKRLVEFKQAGKKINKGAVESDAENLNTAQWRHEVAIRTDAKLNNLDGDAVMEKLRQEVAEHIKAA